MGPELGEQFFELLPFLLGLLGIAIVSIVGWLIWVFTRPGGRQKSGQDVAPPQPAGTLAAPGNVPPAPPAPLLAVTRGLGGWEIRVRGQRYASLEAVPDARTRAEVIEALRHLARFAQDTIQRQRTEGRAATGAEPREAPRKEAPAPPRTMPSAPVTRTSRDDLVGADPALRRAGPASPLMPALNLAQEIGDIVEELLSQTPSLQGHAVTLNASPSGGVMFIVDGKLYHDIDEIPVPEIRELIRRATKEWERR